MPKHANEPLPRFALFITERAAQIAQHYQVMRQPSLSKGSASHPPAPGTAGKSQLHRVRGLAFQASAQPQFLRGKPQQALFRATQQTFAGAIDQPQLRVVVERTDGQANLLHTVRSRALASMAPKRCCRSTSLRALTSIITSPMASSLRPPRARSEKSSSRSAAKRFESVCSEKTTRFLSEKAKPSQSVKMRNASVQTAPEE